MIYVRRTIALACLLTLYSCANVPDSQRPRRNRAGKTAVQALIGATDYHKLEFEHSDPAVPADTAEADLSTMPALGIAGQYAIGGERIEIGLDGGLLFSWDNDDARFISTGSGTVVLIDRGLLVADLFFGPYLSTILADRVRLYAAAGASLMYGDADYRDEIISDSESAFGVGVYGRAGAEIRLVDRSFLGLGVRWVSTELDFGQPIGDVDVEGWQGFLTYTVGF
jgi:opacity protein-like surface antigen